MFSFLSALGYKLSVLDDDSGRLSALDASAAAAFNNESRWDFLRNIIPVSFLSVTPLRRQLSAGWRPAAAADDVGGAP